MGRELGLSGDDVLAVQSEVLGWISARLRPLPWRATRDPWAILVSEVMLQQTGVQRVLPKWEVFMETFPRPSDCAGAELGEVLRIWQGLGYPRRARNLHRAATVIVADHGGRVPNDLEKLLALPGVGRYTARAVLAFAFDIDTAVVDVNVVRVLARLSGQRLTAGRAQTCADELLTEGEAWLWNQAMMDLGALVCRPTPLCGQCPVETWCAWQGSGPDPSAGSAGVGQAQGRFEGSDRQARGRLIRVLGDRTVRTEELGTVMDRPQVRAERLAVALVEEGLVKNCGGVYSL